MKDEHGLHIKDYKTVLLKEILKGQNKLEIKIMFISRLNIVTY